jgi:hypothetical protein
MRAATKKIELTKDEHAIIDDDDYDIVNEFSWYAHDDGKGNIYAATRILGDLVYMHQLIMDRPGQPVDHKNGNMLDNRRENLRPVSDLENARNKGKSEKGEGKSSEHKGVTKISEDKWKAHIGIEDKDFHIGYFESEEEAARAYDKEAVEIFGEHARLNFP